MAPHPKDGGSSPLPTPSFYKVIRPYNIRDKKVMIPRKFVETNGNELSNSAVLEVPGGKQWRVELVNRNGEIWLEKGWEEFADFYSLQADHFVFFENLGNSHFPITIFDKSFFEIRYPTTPAGSYKIPDNLPMREQAEDNVDPLHSRQGVGQIGKALQMARDFTSDNPSFFRVVRPSYLSKNCTMTVPVGFAYLHFPNSKGDAVLLLNAMDERTQRRWTVGYNFYEKSTARTVSVLRGWRKFSQDNNLKVGDVCLFELIKLEGIELAFRVRIFRDNEDGDVQS